MKIQATSVALDGGAILITGDEAVGKSSLAWALIQRCGATLISDDVTEVFVPLTPTLSLKGRGGKGRGSVLLASPLEQMRGCIALRGIGIITGQKTAEKVPVLCVIKLVDNCTPHPNPFPSAFAVLLRQGYEEQEATARLTQGEREGGFADIAGYAVRQFILNQNDSMGYLKAKTFFDIVRGKITLFSDLDVLEREKTQKGVKK